jgi:hypothetical protein
LEQKSITNLTKEMINIKSREKETGESKKLKKDFKDTKIIESKVSSNEKEIARIIYTASPEDVDNESDENQ